MKHPLKKNSFRSVKYTKFLKELDSWTGKQSACHHDHVNLVRIQSAALVFKRKCSFVIYELDLGLTFVVAHIKLTQLCLFITAKMAVERSVVWQRIIYLNQTLQNLENTPVRNLQGFQTCEKTKHGVKHVIF